MLDPATGLSLAAILVGVGGAVVAMFKVGPEKTSIVVSYQAQVLEDIREENHRLLSLNASLTKRVEYLENLVFSTEARLKQLENGQA